MVEIIEITDDDGHGQGDGQHARDGAQRADQLAPHSHRPHVSVADGGHRDDGPPKGARDGPELSLGVIGVGEEHGRRKQDDADEEEEHEQRQFAHRRLQSLAENLQTFGMSRQFKDSEHSDETNDPQNGERRRLVGLLGLVGDDGAESDEVTKARRINCTSGRNYFNLSNLRTKVVSTYICMIAIFQNLDVSN